MCSSCSPWLGISARWLSQPPTGGNGAAPHGRSCAGLPLSVEIGLDPAGRMMECRSSAARPGPIFSKRCGHGRRPEHRFRRLLPRSTSSPTKNRARVPQRMYERSRHRGWTCKPVVLRQAVSVAIESRFTAPADEPRRRASPPMRLRWSDRDHPLGSTSSIPVSRPRDRSLATCAICAVFSNVSGDQRVGVSVAKAMFLLPARRPVPCGRVAGDAGSGFFHSGNRNVPYFAFDRGENRTQDP